SLRTRPPGAARADAALLLAAAAASGPEQPRRHSHLLHLLGVRQLVVVINKMDRVGYDAARFRAIAAEIGAHLGSLGLVPAAVIPISARHGDGVVQRTPALDWYDGPTVIAALDGFPPPQPPPHFPPPLPVQPVHPVAHPR